MSRRLIICSGEKLKTIFMLHDEHIEKECIETEEWFNKLSRDRKNKLRIQSIKIQKYGHDDTGQGCHLHSASQEATKKSHQHINLFQDKEMMLKTARLRWEIGNDSTKREIM